MTRSYLRMKHLILTAMGITALASTACSSTVVVEGGTGGGGATGTTGNGAGPTTTSGSGGSGGTPFTCDEPPGGLEYACLPLDNGSCPSPADALFELDAILGGECPTSEPDFCGCWESVVDVPCGPDPTVQDECCYYAQMVQEEICEGRPFQIDGEARVAELACRGDWRLEDLRPEVASLNEVTRRALACAWEEDGLFEHASIASFARFVLELLAVGAPADLVAEAQQALADEIVHAKQCFAMASAYRGEDVGPGALSIDGGLAERHDLRSVAVATAIEGCINETLATIVAHEAAAAATDPAARTTLTAIAEDESRHAALAWRFVAWACERDAATRQAVAQAFHQAAASAAGDPLPLGTDHDAMRAHGQLSLAERQAVLRRGFDDVVRPCAEALVGPAADHAVKARAASAALA